MARRAARLRRRSRALPAVAADVPRPGQAHRGAVGAGADDPAMPGAWPSSPAARGPAVAVVLGVGSGSSPTSRAARWRARAPRADAVAAILGGAGTLAIAFVGSQISPAWTALLRCARRPADAAPRRRAGPSARIGLVALALLARCGCSRPRSRQQQERRPQRGADRQSRRHRGDIVVSTHRNRFPCCISTCRAGLRWADGMGWVRRSDVHGLARRSRSLSRRAPDAGGRQLVGALKPGQQLVLVQPIIATASWGAPWTELVRSAQCGGSVCSAATIGSSASRRCRSCVASVSPAACASSSTAGSVRNGWFWLAPGRSDPRDRKRCRHGRHR